MKPIYSDNRGLTIIELITATAITTILIVIVMNFLTNQMAENARQNARSELLLEAQTSLDVINSDIKHSARVDDTNRWEDPYAPDTSDPYSWQPTDEVLILAAPAKDESNDFIYDDPFAYITHKDNYIYFVEDGTLYRRILAGDDENNAATSSCPPGTEDCSDDMTLINNVTDFHVDYLDSYDQEVTPDEARSVRVSISVVDEVYNRDITAEHSVRSVFRNE